MAVADRVRDLILPLIELEGVDLYDVEHAGGVVRVLVDDDDGVELSVVARLTRAIGRTLDEHDPIPGRYTLEVSSPGLERPLRTADHFRRAVGSDVKVKTRPEVEGPRRLRGTLISSSDDEMVLRDDEGSTHTVAHRDIVSARTVFEWGPAPKPGGANRRSKKSKREATNS